MQFCSKSEEGMAKRLKLRLSRILSNCRSKDVAPSDPLPVLEPIPTSLSHSACSPTLSARKQTLRWKQEKDFHVISISTVREEPLASMHVRKEFPSPSAARRVRRRRAMMQWGRKHGRAHLAPLPSIGMDRAWNKEGMEEEDREETEYLMSSSDKEASDSEASAAEKAEEQGMLLMRRRVSEVEFEARLSTVERRHCCGDRVMRMTPTMTKVRESYAVVKRTEDPYGEFRRSIMEMVTEKEMHKEDELRDLLRCLLSLNGGEHHGIIIRAFAEVCDALFEKKVKLDRHRDWFTTSNNY